MAGTIGRSGGSNRRSTRRKALLSTYRPDRDKRTAVERARPVRPAWLVDAIAVAAWDRICDLLAERGTLSLGDADAVLLVAVAEAEYRAADALLVDEGLVVQGREGPRAHPATKLRADAWKRWAAGLSRLGLDPITRGRIDRAPLPDHDNPFKYI